MLIKSEFLSGLLTYHDSVAEKEACTLIILVGEETEVEVDGLIRGLNDSGIAFIGGVFPGVIWEGRLEKSGIVVMHVPVKNPIFIVRDLHKKGFNLPDFDHLKMPGTHKLSGITLVDGLAANISAFLQQLYSQLGDSVNFVGGGAGWSSLERKACLLTPEGCLSDAAVICFTEWQSKIGVKHGWTRINGPVVATRTNRNMIIELNWEKAIDVYREIVEKDSGMQVEEANFFEVAKGYPFGIFKEGNEDVVRDPYTFKEDGSLVCVGEVPENSVLGILKGAPTDLIQAARQATQESFSMEAAHPHTCLVFDCISRALYLGEGFETELGSISEAWHQANGSTPVMGALTLGEIASHGVEGSLEFYNKTIVITSLFI